MFLRIITEIIKLLLSNKANPNVENRMAHSPAVIATAKGNPTLLSIILGAKATDPSKSFCKILANMSAQNKNNVNYLLILKKILLISY